MNGIKIEELRNYFLFRFGIRHELQFILLASISSWILEHGKTDQFISFVIAGDWSALGGHTWDTEGMLL